MRPDRKPLPSDDYTITDKETGELLHDEHGREIPDPTPMQPPVGYNRQPSLSEQIRTMIVSERLAREAAEAGFETFEEADDFDVGDDFDQERESPYEANFDPMTPQERAALATHGRDPSIVPDEDLEAHLPSPKPKKTKSGSDKEPVVKGAGSAGDSSEAEGEA